MKFNKTELFRTIKYFLIAISAAGIQMATAFLLELIIFKHTIPDGATLHFIIELDKSSFIAESIGLACSIVWNFTFNRKYTFRAASNVPVSMALAFLFYVPFYPFQIWYIDAVRKSLLGAIGEDWAFVIAQVTVILMNGVLEFLWQRFVVFGKKVDTNERALPTRDSQPDVELPHEPSNEESSPAAVEETSSADAAAEATDSND